MWYDAINNVVEKHGGYPTEYMYFGIDLSEYWELIKERGNVEKTIPTQDLKLETQNEFIKLFRESKEDLLTPGFFQLMGELKSREFKTALVTNSDKKYVEEIVQAYRLDLYFDQIIYGDNVRHRKPNPEIYKKALQLLKVKSSEAVAFEDSVAGATSASKAGLKMIVIWSGNEEKLYYPSEVFDFVEDFTVVSERIDNDMDSVMEKKIPDYKNLKI
jgi:HAD superfamily hydrolase (TIGR01509 family)